MRGTSRLRVPAAIAVAVVLVGGGATYAVSSQEDSPRYRTVAAVTSDVEETFSSSGVVDAAQRADLSFGTAGTLVRLAVSLGETVKAGQVVARLDDTDLESAVTEAEAGLAQAVAQLDADKTAQASAVAQAASSSATGDKTSGTGSGAQSGAGAGSDSGSDPGSDSGSENNSALLKAFKALQEEVIQTQSAASQALSAASSALAAQVEVCAAVNATPTVEPGDTAEPEPGADTPPTEAADGGVSAGSSTPPEDACAVALGEVAERQGVVSDAQDELAQALNDLADALTKALGNVGGPSTEGGNASGEPTRPATDQTAQTTQTAGSGSSAAGNTISAARLASDQAQIEQAQADLVAAQQERAQAVLRATRSGKVAAVAVSVGDAVSAGDEVVTILGGSAVRVVGSATEEQRASLKIGQTVRVTVPGSEASADSVGEVTAISLVADSSSGTPSYPFTVTVENPAIALPTGSRALLAVVVSTAAQVVTVPTSAVARDGSVTGDRGTVEVLSGSTPTRTTVSLGAVGDRAVEITDGLVAGQLVVLAAIDDPIEGAESELTQRGGFGGQVRGVGGAGGAGGAGGGRAR